MIGKFLWKGVIRDRRRSLLPVIVVTIGVFFVVFLDGFMAGMLGNMVRTTAKYQTGHMKVMTRAYEKDQEQMPLDLALLGTGELIEKLDSEFPEADWTPRISFGGLLDIPDSEGSTKAQGPVSGTGYDLLSPGSREAERIGLQNAVVEGRIIENNGEILISSDFAGSYDVKPGNEVTFFGSTMYGSMSFSNYTVAGVVRFGTAALDRGAVILDITDARLLTDMDDAASEIFGFLPGDIYDREMAESIKQRFNAHYEDDPDEFAPVMLQLSDQQMMSQLLTYVDNMSFIIVFLLVLALSVVLWNTGLLGGIRRYNEFGVRLALGEDKGHLYRTLLVESLFIGLIGSFIGTVLGVALCSWLSKHGINYGSMLDNFGMMIDPVIRAEVRPSMFWIGFIPGVGSMLIGSALAGRAVYKRNTANLFKELD